MTDTPIQATAGPWSLCVEGSWPPMAQPVLLAFRHGLSFGARVDCGDGSWLWGVKTGWTTIDPAQDADQNEIAADDVYEPTHWMALPSLPARATGAA